MLVLCLILGAAPPPPPPTAALVIERVSTACEASAGALSAVVAAHLGGRDPFDPAAGRKAHVRWWRSGVRFVADLALVEADGRRGERRLEDASCPELIASVALALAIAIDPLAALGASPGAPAPITSEARPREPEAAIDRREPAPPPGHGGVGARAPALRVTGAFTLGLTLGAAPAVALGPGLRVELGDRWRGALEVGAAFAGPAPIARTRVDVVRLEARAEGCRVGTWVACAGLVYTRWRASATDGLERPVDAARDSLALAATIGLALASVRLELGLAVALTPRARLTLDGDTAFRAWPVMPHLRLVASP